VCVFKALISVLPLTSLFVLQLRDLVIPIQLFFFGGLRAPTRFCLPTCTRNDGGFVYAGGADIFVAVETSVFAPQQQ